jgi:Domain of unknown function (DUF5658)
MSLRTGGVGRRVTWVVALALLLLIPARVFAQQPPAPSSTRPLVPLYLSFVSFAVLQALDVHSTTRALNAGAVEGNPLMRGVADQPAALMAVKAGGAASTIWLTHKLARRSKTGAFVVMAAVNSAYAMIVAHNYRAGR